MEGSVVDLRELVGLAGVPAVLAIVELVKRVYPGVEGRWLPLLVLGVALTINVGVGYKLGFDLVVAAVTGLLVGLAASGLYSQGKTVMER